MIRTLLTVVSFEGDCGGKLLHFILFFLKFYVYIFSACEYVILIFYFNVKSELSGLLGLRDASGLYLYFSTLKTARLSS